MIFFRKYRLRRASLQWHKALRDYHDAIDRHDTRAIHTTHKALVAANHRYMRLEVG